VAPALIFVAAGMILGSSGLHVVELDDDTAGFTVLAQLALTVILFNHASTIDLRKALQRRHLPLRLLAIGVPVTFLLGTLTAVLLLPVLPLWEAVCLAVIVAPTEVALIDALVEDARIPEQVRHALSVESGLYDGFALAALYAALAIASENTDPTPARWAWFAVETELVSVLVGVVIGLVGGLVIGRSRAHGWMSDTWAQLATVALALVSFGLAEKFHGSGFVAAFACGLTYAALSPTGDERPAATQVSDATGQLLELLVFTIFGGFAVISTWREAGWRVVLFAVLSLAVVRVVAVLIALAGSGLSLRDTLFIGWFGPRGIGTLVLGLLVVDRGEIQHEPLIGQVVVITVTLSLVLHSLTARPGIRLCAARQRDDAVTGDVRSHQSTINDA
jgi:NhaP-type Na+/H+ or K+/H+ antiporter